MPKSVLQYLFFSFSVDIFQPNNYQKKTVNENDQVLFQNQAQFWHSCCSTDRLLLIFLLLFTHFYKLIKSHTEKNLNRRVWRKPSKQCCNHFRLQLEDRVKTESSPMSVSNQHSSRMQSPSFQNAFNYHLKQTGKMPLTCSLSHALSFPSSRSSSKLPTSESENWKKNKKERQITSSGLPDICCCCCFCFCCFCFLWHFEQQFTKVLLVFFFKCFFHFIWWWWCPYQCLFGCTKAT